MLRTPNHNICFATPSLKSQIPKVHCHCTRHLRHKVVKFHMPVVSPVFLFSNRNIMMLRLLFSGWNRYGSSIFLNKLFHKVLLLKLLELSYKGSRFKQKYTKKKQFQIHKAWERVNAVVRFWNNRHCEEILPITINFELVNRNIDWLYSSRNEFLSKVPRIKIKFTTNGFSLFALLFKSFLRGDKRKVV